MGRSLPAILNLGEGLLCDKQQSITALIPKCQV